MATERKTDHWPYVGLLTGALIATLATAPLSTASTPPRHPRAWDTAVEMDGAGGIRVWWQGEPAMELALTLAGGRLSDPTTWREVELTASGGAVTVLRAAPDAPLRVEIPHLDGTLQVRRRTWNYFHLDEILFLDATFQAPRPQDLAVDPGIRIRTDGDLTVEPWLLSPHVSAGRAPARAQTVAAVRLARGGRTLWLAVVRLDQRPAEIVESGLVWPGALAAGWPLAVVLAPARAVLEYALGQALLTYAGPDLQSPGSWMAPPLCARCQHATVEELRARLDRRQDALEITLVAPADRPAHLPLVAEAVWLGGHPLEPYLRRKVENGAVYRVPLHDPVAIDLLQRRGAPRAELMLSCGRIVAPQTISIERDPALPASPLSTRLPSHLSSRLVEAWPNPFHERTMLHIQVPATVEAAFDLQAAGIRLEAVDLQAAPPFGLEPYVRVRVYNVSGQLLRSLDEALRSPGEFQVTWDGTDDQGQPTAAGAYYVNVDMGGYSVTRRVVRLKP